MGARKSKRRPKAGAADERDGDGAAMPAERGVGKKYTPEQRRQAVEAFHKSGLTQKAFAGQWNLSHVTLGKWLLKYAEEGPKGLERVAAGPRKRRGRAPLADAVRDEVVAVQRRFPDFGLKKVRHFLRRFSGLSLSLASVRRIRKARRAARGVDPGEAQAQTGAAAAVRAVAPGRPVADRHHVPERAVAPRPALPDRVPRRPQPLRRRPRAVHAPARRHRDRRVPGGLPSLRQAEGTALRPGAAVLRVAGQERVPEDARKGRRGITSLARAHHPETVGKTERFWETLKRELWDRVHPKDLEDARERIKHFVAHHNHQRPHQSLDGLVPADRFFGVASEVRAAMEAAIARNELRLALGETPRKPVYLVGQIDGQAVSLHGEQGRLVVQTPDGKRQEIETKDLGAHPHVKETNDAQSKQQQQSGADGAGHVADESDDVRRRR